MDKDLFFYELEGRGYTFQNKKWDETKHGFEDDMLNMAWEMWSSAKHSIKAQAVPEGFVLMPKEPTDEIIEAMNEFDYRNDYSDMDGAYRTIVETLEKAQEDAEREQKG